MVASSSSSVRKISRSAFRLSERSFLVSSLHSLYWSSLASCSANESSCAKEICEFSVVVSVVIFEVLFFRRKGKHFFRMGEWVVGDFLLEVFFLS